MGDHNEKIELNESSRSKEDSSTDLKKPTPEIVPPPPLFSLHSQRLRIGLMLMTGIYTVVSMRLNLSMAVVCMVNSTAYSPVVNEPPMTTVSPLIEYTEAPKCERQGNAMASNGYNGTLLWTPQMQSLLFSATFYGSLVTLTASGTIADRYGPKICFGGAAIIYIVVTMLSPLLAEYSFTAYFISRFIMGFAEGFVFPAAGSMAGKWFPPNERSRIAAIYTSGNQFAASLTSLISSSLCASPLGWPSIFYLFGSLGVVWLFGWSILATNDPQKNKFISTAEADYLKENTHKKTAKTVPWREVFRCKALHAALCANFSYNFTATLTQVFLPTYFRDELLLSLGKNGLYTMIPFVAILISKQIFSITADMLKTKGILQPTQCCKIFQMICSFGCSTTMIGLGTLPSCERPWIAGVLLALYGIFFSAGIPGYFTSLLSLAPSHSGTMMSFGKTSGSIANIFTPLLLTSIMFLNTRHTWSILFIFGGVINIISGIIFYHWGSADIQEWAKDEKAAKGIPVTVQEVPCLSDKQAA